MIEDKLGLFEASRALTHLMGEVTDEVADDDFRVFVLLEDDTAHIPSEDRRAQWADSYLEELDRERSVIETRHREDALEACRRLIARFGGAAG